MRILCAVLLLPAAALAHQSSVSYGELSVHGREVAGVLRFSLTDLRSQMQLQDPSAPPLPALGRLVLDPYRIRATQGTCALQPGLSAQPDGDDGLAVHARWLCPEPIEELSVRVGFLDSFPPGHTHLARIEFGPGEISQRVAQRDEPSFEARRAPDAGREFRRFLLLGVQHIFTGYDHIAFLLGLLLLGGTLLELVKIVTAFTVAHSITLALAALNLMTPPVRVIEPLIAASIVFVGAENLWALRRGALDAALRHRWMLTFAFGLVHGFGFAAVLRELQLPRSTLAAGLVAFNLGVECGQVCIVVVALPLLRWLRRFRGFAPAASFCVLALGGLWLVLRVVRLS
jgi:hydrogenase/urease accessory protein HupE